MMVDRMALMERFPPWEPSAVARMVRTYLFYDVPRIGVIAQAGDLYLFRCVEGYADEAQVWAYIGIDPHDMRLLDEKVNTRQFWELLRGLTVYKPMSLAVATDADGIVEAWDKTVFAGPVSIMDGPPITSYLADLADAQGRLPAATRQLLHELASA